MIHAHDIPLNPENLESLRVLEENLWRTDTRFDNEVMEKIFAEDFFEFGRSGQTYARTDLIFDPSKKREIKATLPLKDFRARHLSEDIVQITYVSEVEHDGVIQHANRSSIWSRTPEGWTLRFHQGTPTS